MQRSAQPLFLMNPLNRAFLQKQITRPKFSEMSANGLWAMFGFFLICLTIFLVLAIPAWKRWLDLRNTGVITQGQVVDYGIQRRSDNYFTVQYAYTVNERTYEVEQRVPAEQFDLVINDQPTIPVRYVANNPTVAQLEAPVADFGDWREQRTLLGGTYLVFMLIMLLIHYDRRSRNSELVAKGKLVKGTVVAAYGNQPEQDSTFMQVVTLFFSRAWYIMRRRNQSEFKVKIRYTFVSPVSQKTISRSETAVRNDLDRRRLPEAGSTVAILFRNDSHFRML